MKGSEAELWRVSTGLLLLAPIYPFLCLLNELGCGDGCGYYNFIPLFLISHRNRPERREWPGVQFEWRDADDK